MTSGFFGKIFDFDGDGKLNTMERAMDFMAFNEMMSEVEKREALEDAGWDSDDCDF
jgi:hypothetical protein